MSTTISDIEFANQCADAIRKTFNQNERSVDATRTCAYKGPNGLRCLVGHMMTDDELKKFGDTEATVGALIENNGWRKDTYTQNQISVLTWLQGAHDESTNQCGFRWSFIGQLRRLVPELRPTHGLTDEAWVIFGDTLESLEQQMMEGSPA